MTNHLDRAKSIAKSLGWKQPLSEGDRVSYKKTRGGNGKAQIHKIYPTGIEAWCLETGNMLLLFEDINKVEVA